MKAARANHPFDSHALEDERPRSRRYIEPMNSRVSLRGLLALLCLLASFAYSTRAVMPVNGLETVQGVAVSGHPSAEQAMADMPMAHESEPAHSEHSHSSSQTPHSHDAHCPFCFSSAFALEGQAFLLPAPLESVRLQQKAARVQASAAWSATHQARGPPSLPVV